MHVDAFLVDTGGKYDSYLKYHYDKSMRSTEVGITKNLYCKSSLRSLQVLLNIKNFVGDEVIDFIIIM